MFLRNVERVRTAEQVKNQKINNIVLKLGYGVIYLRHRATPLDFVELLRFRQTM